MVPRYVAALLPLFCQSYKSTMIQSIKRSSLGLIKKMLFYLTATQLSDICKDSKQTRQDYVGPMVEVLASVLNNDEEEESHLTCLLILKDIISKDKEDIFYEYFAKLGLYSKVINY